MVANISNLYDYYTIHRGYVFDKGCHKRYVVIDYTEKYVFLVKFRYLCGLPFSFVKKISYEKLNKEYTREYRYGD